MRPTLSEPRSSYTRELPWPMIASIMMRRSEINVHAALVGACSLVFVERERLCWQLVGTAVTHKPPATQVHAECVVHDFTGSIRGTVRHDCKGRSPKTLIHPSMRVQMYRRHFVH